MDSLFPPSPPSSRSSSDELKLKKMIGRGAFGSVYVGVWRGSKVAVKRFHATRGDFDQDEREKILEEIRILERIRFSRVVQFYGCIEYQGCQTLVMEYIDGGTLSDAILKRRLLKDGSNDSDDWSTRIRIAGEIAEGLAHIHQHGILHRDLKSTNILLAYGIGVKLCDFGLAVIKTKSASASYVSDKFKGTLRWMAPELLVLRPRYSPASDIYALGMVMWEMAANCTKPFKEQESNEVVANCVKAGERENVPENTPTVYADIINQCWKQDPKERITAKAVEEVFTQESDGSDAESVISPSDTSDIVSVTWEGTTGLVGLNLPTPQPQQPVWSPGSVSSQNTSVNSDVEIPYSRKVELTEGSSSPHRRGAELTEDYSLPHREVVEVTEDHSSPYMGFIERAQETAQLRDASDRPGAPQQILSNLKDLALRDHSLRGSADATSSNISRSSALHVQHVPQSIIRSPQLVPSIGLNAVRPSAASQFLSQPRVVGPFRRNFPVVVGIEIGDLFSSCSFCLANDINDFHDVTRWHTNIRDPTQVPTIVLYNRDDDSPRHLRSWGSKARQDSKKFAAPFLISNLRRRIGIGTPIMSTRELTPPRIMADFLRSFHTHALSEIELLMNWCQQDDLRYCFTVPSSWQEYKLNIFHETIVDAGIISKADPPERLLLVTEAEAVAEYCLHRAEGWSIQSDSYLFVCNLREDWLEITVLDYRHTANVHSAGNHDHRPTVVESNTVRSLGLTRLDTGLQSLLKDAITCTWKNLQLEKRGTLTSEFRESIVSWFNGDDDQFLRPPEDVASMMDEYGGDDLQQLDDGFLVFRAQDLKDHVFDPLVIDIYDHLVEMVRLQLERGGDERKRCMFLLIGQERQAYLAKQLERRLNARGFDLIIPPRSDKAIVRGAVYVGLRQHTETRQR